MLREKLRLRAPGSLVPFGNVGPVRLAGQLNIHYGYRSIKGSVNIFIKMNKDSKIRNFIATSYNVEDAQDYLGAAFEVLKLTYCVGQVEMCPLTGRLHV